MLSLVTGVAANYSLMGQFGCYHFANEFFQLVLIFFTMSILTCNPLEDCKLLSIGKRWILLDSGLQNLYPVSETGKLHNLEC